MNAISFSEAPASMRTDEDQAGKPASSTRIRYAAGASEASVSGVRPTCASFTYTVAPLGWEMTVRAPEVGAGGFVACGTTGNGSTASEGGAGKVGLVSRCGASR